jgi:CO/xanthine dehydrogenase FAD-binding subunit
MSRQTQVSVGQAPAVEYLFPHSVEEAVRLLLDGPGETRILAGGTDVLPDIRKGRIQPRRLVDITRIPGLDEIRVTDEFVEVGAAVTFADIARCPFIDRQVHALAEAARCVGAQAIQNAATWVGNLVQAMPAADGAIVALALDAEARVVDGEQREWRAVEALFLGPGISAVDPTRQLVTHIRFPRWNGRWGTAWSRLGRRPSLVLPILNCAVRLCLDDAGRQIEEARIALGPVAPRPYRARGAERYLEDKVPSAQVLAQAARLVQEEAQPRDSITRASRAYRLDVIPPLVEAALESAAQRALSGSTDGSIAECSELKREVHR